MRRSGRHAEDDTDHLCEKESRMRKRTFPLSQVYRLLEPGPSVARFTDFRLTPEPASLVAAPLIVECYANLECKVVDTRMVTKYNFFILEVCKAWIDPLRKGHRGA